MEPLNLTRWRAADAFDEYEYRDFRLEPTPEQKRIWGCEEYRALPASDFAALLARLESAERERDAFVALFDPERKNVVYAMARAQRAATREGA